MTWRTPFGISWNLVLPSVSRTAQKWQFPLSTDARVANPERWDAAALRTLYAFNPFRSAILLIRGEKTGDDRWYEKFVPIADRLFERHLLELKKGRSI